MTATAIRTAAEPPVAKVRADALPEFTRYRDDGCDIHPHCLTCPLPRCRYDEPGGLRGLLNAYRDRQIVELRQRGVPVDELAQRFGLSRRTIFRVLERPASESGNGNGNGGKPRDAEAAPAAQLLFDRFRIERLSLTAGRQSRKACA